MTHDQIRDALIMLDDPELPETERRGLLAHLRECGECATLVRQWRSVRGAMDSSVPEASEAFVEAVMGRVPAAVARPVPAPARWRIPAWIMPLLGVAFAAALLLPLLLPREPGSTDPALSTETLLLARAPEGSAWEFASDTPDAELLLSVNSESP